MAKPVKGAPHHNALFTRKNIGDSLLARWERIWQNEWRFEKVPQGLFPNTWKVCRRAYDDPEGSWTEHIVWRVDYRDEKDRPRTKWRCNCRDHDSRHKQLPESFLCFHLQAFLWLRP